MMEALGFIFGLFGLVFAVRANSKIAKLKTELSAAGVLKNDQN